MNLDAKNILPVIKSNIVITICVVVIIGALVGLPYISSGFEEEVKAGVEKKNKTYTILKRIRDGKITIPGASQQVSAVVNKSIIDKIQDVALHHGPLLNSLGLASLTIETAGASAQAGAAATLVGVVDAVSFRDAILEQREAVTGQKALPAPTGDQDVLIQIRDSLERIETLLARG